MQAAFIFLAAAVLCLAQNDPKPDEVEWRDLRQADFDSGTYRIKEPGYYRLVENVWFNPRPVSEPGVEPVVDAYSAYQTTPADNTEYDKFAYKIGFWCAIAIEASHVTLDLNGFTIGQHKAHNLMNRYFNVIELANIPFLKGQGFTNFGPVGELALETLVPANYVTIRNGNIDRAATNGIHGTGNQYILVEDVAFRNFETAAVNFYGGQYIILNRLNAWGASDVPVNSLWDTALNLRPFINALAAQNPSYTLQVQGVKMTSTQLRDDLRGLINAVYDRVITNNKYLTLTQAEKADPNFAALFIASNLFQNDARKPDGNCFGYSVTSRFYDVDGFPYGFREVDAPSQYVNITYCAVNYLSCSPNEVVALASGYKNTVVDTEVFPILDPRGHVVSLLNMVWDYTSTDLLTQGNATLLTISAPPAGTYDFSNSMYIGNPVANTQIIVGKAIFSGLLNESSTGLNVRRSTVNPDFVAWVEATPGSPRSLLSWYTDAANERNWICNSDEIYRVQMGVVGFRLSSVWDLWLHDTQAYNIENVAWPGSMVCGYTNYTRSHPRAVYTGYLGADARGFALASVRRADMWGNFVKGINSNWGSIVAFDFMTDTQDVLAVFTEIKDGYAGSFVAIYDAAVQAVLHLFYDGGPTRFPSATGIHTDQRSRVTLDYYCVNGLLAAESRTYKSALANSTQTTWDRATSDGEWPNCHTGGEPWWIWLLLAFVCLVFILALLAVILACMGGGDNPGSYQEMKG